VSTSSSSKRRRFRRADWFVGACLVAAIAVPWTSGVFEASEVRSHDVFSKRSSRQPSDHVATAAIVSTTFFLESQTDRGLVFVRKVKDALAAASETRGVPRDGGVAATSYDPPAKAAAADDPFASTAVFRRPGGPAHSEGGEGQSASEA